MSSINQSARTQDGRLKSIDWTEGIRASFTREFANRVHDDQSGASVPFQTTQNPSDPTLELLRLKVQQAEADKASAEAAQRAAEAESKLLATKVALLEAEQRSSLAPSSTQSSRLSGKVSSGAISPLAALRHRDPARRHSAGGRVEDGNSLENDEKERRGSDTRSCTDMANDLDTHSGAKLEYYSFHPKKLNSPSRNGSGTSAAGGAGPSALTGAGGAPKGTSMDGVPASPQQTSVGGDGDRFGDGSVAARTGGAKGRASSTGKSPEVNLFPATSPVACGEESIAGAGAAGAARAGAAPSGAPPTTTPPPKEKEPAATPPTTSFMESHPNAVSLSTGKPSGDARRRSSTGGKSRLEKDVTKVCNMIRQNPGEAWEKRAQGMQELRQLFEANAEARDDFTVWTRGVFDAMVVPFDEAIKDLRSSMTKEVGDALVCLAESTKDECGPFLYSLLPSIVLTLNSGTRVIAEYMDTAFSEVLVHSRMRRGLTYMCREATTSKSAQLRHTLVKYYSIVLTHWGKHFLKKEVDAFSAALEKALKDPKPDVKQLAREAFLLFQPMFPTHSATMMEKLDKRTKTAIAQEALKRQGR